MITNYDLARYINDPHQFRREQVVLPNGKLYGDAEEPWQREHIWQPLDAKDAAGNPKHHVLYEELSRGHAKSTQSAIAVLTAAMLEDSLEIYFFAGDTEQAAIGFTMLTKMIQANPDIAPSFRILKDRIEVPSTGTVIKVMASDAATAFGIGGMAKGLLVIIDEFWVWKSQLLWEAIISSTGKVGANWRVLILSNAGIDGESTVAWPVREACRLRKNDAYYFFRSDGCIASWITDEWKEQQRDLLTPGGYVRLIDNEWTSSESQFISGDEWDALVDSNLAPMPRIAGAVLVGVDASLGKTPDADTTAAAATMPMLDGSCRLIAHRIWTPQPGGIDYGATIAPFLMELQAMYGASGGVMVLYDPYQLEHFARQMRARGLWMEPYPQTTPNLSKMAMSLLDVVRTRRLKSYPCPDLREHVLNATLIETPRGARIAKEKSSKKVDGCVALAMSLQGALEAPLMLDEGPAWTDEDEYLLSKQMQISPF